MARNIRTLALALGFTALGAATTLTTGALADSWDDDDAYEYGYGRGHHGYGQRGPGAAWGPDARMAILADDLGLDDAQREKFTALRDAMRDVRQQMWERRGTRMSELMELAADDDVDRDAIHARIDERAAEMAQSMHQVADLALDFRDSLSPEQRALFRQHLEYRWSGRSDWAPGDCDGRGRGRGRR